MLLEPFFDNQISFFVVNGVTAANALCLNVYRLQHGQKCIQRLLWRGYLTKNDCYRYFRVFQRETNFLMVNVYLTSREISVRITLLLSLLFN